MTLLLDILEPLPLSGATDSLATILPPTLDTGADVTLPVPLLESFASVLQPGHEIESQAPALQSTPVLLQPLPEVELSASSFSVVASLLQPSIEAGGNVIIAAPPLSTSAVLAQPAIEVEPFVSRLDASSLILDASHEVEHRSQAVGTSAAVLQPVIDTGSIVIINAPVFGVVALVLRPEIFPPPGGTIPGVGAITPKEDLLQETLAGLSKMQSWLGVNSEDAAIRKIFVGDLPPPPNGCEVYEPEDLIGMRPFAILYTEPQAGFRAVRDAMGVTFHFGEGGRLVVMFEQEIDPRLRYRLADVRRKFMNDLGEIAYELLSVAGIAGKLAVTKLTVFGPYRGDDDDVQGQGDPIVGYFDLEWGNA